MYLILILLLTVHVSEHILLHGFDQFSLVLFHRLVGADIFRLLVHVLHVILAYLQSMVGIHGLLLLEEVIEYVVRDSDEPFEVVQRRGGVPAVGEK